MLGENNYFVPLNYFNIVKLSKGERFTSNLKEYESCIVPATGSVNVNVNSYSFNNIGVRETDVWDGEPEAVYVPTGEDCEITCLSPTAEIFIAGAKYEKTLTPFAVRTIDLDVIQYGSDDTKTHRKIKHILGAKHHDKVGRLLCNELYTVGQGGWSGFPPVSYTHLTLPTKA